MGVGFVLIIYLVVLAALTAPAVFICGGIGYFVARKRSQTTKTLFVIGGSLFPVAVSAYAFVSLIAFGVAGYLSGRDIGFGDGFDVPLHNHYHWSAIDIPDSAYVYDSRDRQAVDADGDFHIDDSDRNAFANVLQLQEEGDWLAGAYGSHDARFDTTRHDQVADRWFLFNTRTHQRMDVANEDALRVAVAQNGIQLDLQTSSAFYASHRFGWWDVVAMFILLIPPVIGIAYLWQACRRILINDPINPING